MLQIKKEENKEIKPKRNTQTHINTHSISTNVLVLCGFWFMGLNFEEGEEKEKKVEGMGATSAGKMILNYIKIKIKNNIIIMWGLREPSRNLWSLWLRFKERKEHVAFPCQPTTPTAILNPFFLAFYYLLRSSTRACRLQLYLPVLPSTRHFICGLVAFPLISKELDHLVSSSKSAIIYLLLF